MRLVLTLWDEHRDRWKRSRGDHNHDFRLHGEDRELFSEFFLFGHISVSLVLLVCKKNGIIKKAFYWKLSEAKLGWAWPEVQSCTNNP